ncbi:MAG TPA: ABC transporter substrate-binding protein [Thermoanaerobaculia bacterium]|nr:ABC transporter substrate-binding protein [Thermoanaerobaculia bacterium]
MRPARLGGRAALAAAILAAAACGAPRPSGLERVTFMMPRYLSSAVGFIAQERGFFEREGLDVELEISNREGNALPGLVQGRIDVYTTGPLSPKYFNVVHRGARIRFVAAAGVYATQGCAYAATVARRELVESGRLTDYASLRGLRISSDRSASSYYLWRRILALGGLTDDDVELIDVPTTTKLEALANGRIDVTTAVEPLVTQLVRHGDGVVWHPTSDVLPDRPSAYVVFGPRLLDERPDLGRRFLAAYTKAAAAYREEGKSERHLAILERETRLGRDDLLAMCWTPWSPDGRIDPVPLREYQEFALGEGLIDAVVPFEQMVDESFLPAAGADHLAAAR